MNRRGFIQGCVAGVATVAIGLRMARGMPPIDLKDAIKTWRWELATDNYFYGVDTAKPWHVEIYRKLFGDDWELVEAQDLMAMAEDGIVVENQEVIVRDEVPCVVTHDAWPKWKDPDTHAEVFEEYSLDPECEEMEAAAVIAMSQGMAAFKAQDGHGPVVEEGFYTSMECLDAAWNVPRIHTTREALFKHG